MSTPAQLQTTSDNQRWWSSWAPYWAPIEDRHLGVFSTAAVLEQLVAPVLVVGAGQGLVVEQLRRHGLAAAGVDLEPRMTRAARDRRGIVLLNADGAALPFADHSFRTVIVATGVVDYLDDETLIGRIVDEAVRVATPEGRLLVACYRLLPRIERVYRRIGVLAPDGRFRLRRIFDLFELLKAGPLACVKQIVRWTGRGYLGTFAYWTRLGIALPRELKAEQRIFAEILERAAADGRDPRELHEAVPASLPYRDAAAIRRLLVRQGFGDCAVAELDDCAIAMCDAADREPSRERNGGSVDGPPAVWTSRLTKRYSGAAEDAVTALDLTVPEGTVYGIIGPNGAGKTTTLSMLCGLVAPDSGRIEFSERISERGVRRALGYVPQELSLHERLSGRENLHFLGRLHRLRGRPLARRVAELLELVGLGGRGDDLVRTYSAGMKRRLNLVAGLIHEPRLILLDEPTVGIDPQSRNLIFETIDDLRAAGTTMLYTTHHMEEADRLCDRIALMDHGRILLEGPPRALVREHGRLRVDLILRQGDARVVEALRAEALLGAVEIVGRRLTAWARGPIPGGELVAAIEQVARRAGADLELCAVVEPDLESLFLAATGKQLRDAPAGVDRPEEAR